jgi:hypothetical protein
MYNSTIAAMPNVDRLKLMKPTNRRNINRPVREYINPKFIAMKLEVIYEGREKGWLEWIDQCDGMRGKNKDNLLVTNLHSNQLQSST